VGNTAVVLVQLFLRDEVYSGVIVGEVVGHCLDVVLDLSLVSAIFSNYEALSCMLLSCGQIGIYAVLQRP
jgi:hypothetical protein